MSNRVVMLAAAGSMIALSAAAEEVRVYNWSDYIDEALLAQFEEQTGYDLIYDVFDSNEVLETKMLAGGSGYDVVVPTGTFLQRQITAGAFQKLDMAKLPNIANMWDAISSRTWAQTAAGSALASTGAHGAVNAGWPLQTRFDGFDQRHLTVRQVGRKEELQAAFRTPDVGTSRPAWPDRYQGRLRRR